MDDLVSGIKKANALARVTSSKYKSSMRTLTAFLHAADPDEGGFWATCLEVPGANGHGETKAECLEDLAAAVKLILELNEEEVLRNDPNAEKIGVAVA